MSGYTRLNPADSGWQELPLGSNTSEYATDTKPVYRKCGNMVQVMGVVKPKTEVASGSTLEIGTLPVGFRPALQVTKICQGSDLNIWMLSISTNGGIYMERYRTGSSRAAVGTSGWLPFSETFLTA